MRILRVIDSMNPANGGPCQGIRNSIPELAKLGVENEVVCSDSPDATFLGKDPFTIHAIGPAKGPWAHNAALIPWLIKNFNRYDVIIAHGLWLFHSHAVRRAIKKYKQSVGQSSPRFYVMPHGMLDPYFQRAEGRKIKALRNWLYWKLIEGRVINNADGVLFTCEEELRLARQPFSPYHPKKELNVGYGVPEPPAFTANMKAAFDLKKGSDSNHPYFLFLSRIHEKKGVDLLLDAYSQWLAKSADPLKVPDLVIAGPGIESDYGVQLQATVSGNSQLKDKVVFPGMLSGEAKWGAFYGCEAFVLPSHQENFGIAVAEALACGRPVLISNQVNIWREILDGGGGLIEDDSLQGAAKLLESWGALPHAEQKAMGQRAKDTYGRFFAIGPAARRMYTTLSNN